MRISKLDIHNFRGFESAQIDFGQSNVSVFIGTNGQGKSTILDLIAILLQQFTSRAPKAIGVKRKLNEMKLLENDIRLGCTSTLNSISIFDSSIKIKQYLTWSISKFLDEPLSQLEEAETFYGSWKEKRKEMQLQDKNLTDFAEKLFRDAYTNLKSIPILVYYQSNRAVFNEVSSPVREKIYQLLSSKYDAYENAFTKKINDFEDFARWFRDEEDKENEMKVWEKDFNYKNPSLQIIREAIEMFFSNNSGSKYGSLRVKREENQIYRSNRSSSASLVITKDGEDLKIEQLSDGEKNLILLVSDIARRLAIANLNTDSALNGNGIVLIDEIELHLHPTCQREVLNGLQKTFCNVQFIVTTHSPLVLANLNDNVQIFSIRRLKDKNITVFPLDKKQFNPYGSVSSRILKLLMGTEERPTEVATLLHAYEEAIDDNRLEEAERLEARLKKIIDPNDPAIVQGAATIEAKLILQEL